MNTRVEPQTLFGLRAGLCTSKAQELTEFLSDAWHRQFRPWHPGDLQSDLRALTAFFNPRLQGSKLRSPSRRSHQAPARSPLFLTRSTYRSMNPRALTRKGAFVIEGLRGHAQVPRRGANVILDV